MKADNKGAGEDMRFILWDDIGDSQDHVDNQCNCNQWKVEIARKELNKSCCIARENQERLAEERMIIIIRNGNEGSHYPEYNDKEDKQ